MADRDSIKEAISYLDNLGIQTEVWTYRRQGKNAFLRYKNLDIQVVRACVSYTGRSVVVHKPKNKFDYILVLAFCKFEKSYTKYLITKDFFRGQKARSVNVMSIHEYALDAREALLLEKSDELVDVESLSAA